MATKKVRKAEKRFDLATFEPIRLVSKPVEEDEVEQIHAFSIDDTDYYVPTKVPFQHSVEAMEIAATQGENAAVRYMLITVLGRDGYDALRTWPDLTEDVWQQVIEIANKIVMAGSGKAR